MCDNCCRIDLFYSNHNKSDKVEDVFAESHFDIKNKVIEIDDTIKNYKKLIDENQIFETKLIENCNKVRNEIEFYAKELKNQIDNITKTNIDKINTFKNDFIKSIQAKLMEITNYILLLTNLKSSFQEVINNGYIVDESYLKNYLNKNIWIETKKPKLIKKIQLSFQEPSIETMITTELSESLKSNEKKDLKIMLGSFITSACVFKENIYTVSNRDDSVNVYSTETDIFQDSINFKKILRKDISSWVLILNNINNIFLYYDCDSSKITCILKLKNDQTFVEIKTLEDCCRITSTFQQTLLVITSSNVMIELSENGEEIRKIKIQTADIHLPFNYNTAHQLKDGRYVVSSNHKKLVHIGLLDIEGLLIRSFTKVTTSSIRTTDGEKFLFFLDRIAGVITVLSTDLQQQHQFNYPGVVSMCYDQTNDKLLLFNNKEIIYFTYRLGMQAAI